MSKKNSLFLFIAANLSAWLLLMKKMKVQNRMEPSAHRDPSSSTRVTARRSCSCLHSRRPRETDRSRDVTTVVRWVQHLRTVLMMPRTISVIGKVSEIYHRPTRRNKLCLELAGQTVNSVLDTGTDCIIDADSNRKIKGVPPLDKRVFGAIRTVNGTTTPCLGQVKL